MRTIALGDDILIKYYGDGANIKSKIYEIFSIRGIAYARVMKVEDGLVMAAFSDIWWADSHWNVKYEDTIQKVGNVIKS